MPRRKKEKKIDSEEDWSKTTDAPTETQEKTEHSLEDIIDFDRTKFPEDVEIKDVNIDYLLKVLRMRAVDSLNPALGYGTKRLDDMLHGKRLRPDRNRGGRYRRGRGGGRNRYNRRFDHRRDDDDRRYKPKKVTINVDHDSDSD